MKKILLTILSLSIITIMFCSTVFASSHYSNNYPISITSNKDQYCKAILLGYTNDLKYFIGLKINNILPEALPTFKMLDINNDGTIGKDDIDMIRNVQSNRLNIWRQCYL